MLKWHEVLNFLQNNPLRKQEYIGLKWNKIGCMVIIIENGTWRAGSILSSLPLCIFYIYIIKAYFLKKLTKNQIK